MSLDGQFIKCPCENWSQVFRENQKTTSHELAAILKAVDALGNDTLAEEGGEQNVGGVISAQMAEQKLDELLVRLASLSETTTLADAEEKKFADRLSLRLEHLSIPLKLSVCSGDECQGEVASDAEMQSFEDMRLDRWIADFLLRRGYLSSASALQEEAGLCELIDTELHENVWAASTDIREKGDYEPALSWCVRHASKLRRNKSSIEFCLHRQRFLQYVREGKRDVALNYAEAHLTSWPETYLNEIQEAMATLLYAGKFDSAPSHLANVMKDSGKEGQQKLSKVFTEEAVSAFGLSNAPILELVMQCGLTALKTTACYDKSDEKGGGAGGLQHTKTLGMGCPVCTHNGSVLSGNLPYCHHAQSALICRISGEMMDGANPPLALPNGQVYGSSALTRIASESVDGKIVCPVTQEAFFLSDARPLYIL